MEYNRLNDTSFPNIETVDPFASQSDFDYSRYDDWQMRIRVLQVPWDLGSVHVGNSIVTGVGNVVKFESDEDRDAWFESKRYAKNAAEFAQGGYDGIEWYTRFRRYHDGDEIRLELPFNTLSRFNYIYVEYIPAPSADDPVNYERGEALKWLYFLRAMKYEAVNCTTAIVMLDYWQTYINHMDIPHMILTRGHAPLAKVDADAFLESPIDNNQYLLAEDVSFADASIVKHSANATMNANNMRAVIFSTADPRGDFGTKAANTWRTPADGSNLVDGVPAPKAFCVPAASLTGLLAAIDSSAPQFKQTIQAIAFVSADLLYMGDTFTFCGYECVLVWGSGKTYDLLTLAKSQFGYESRYADLAKLYTAPYAHIEIVGDDGGVTRLAIEDCDNALKVVAHAQMTFPFINIDSRLSGAGGAGGQISFQNAAAESFAFDGRWYEYAKTWSVPTFSIVQQASIANDYGTHFDRKQQAFAADQAKVSADASADTAHDNAINSADAAHDNATDSAGTAYDNATLTNDRTKKNADKQANTLRANATAQIANNTAIKDANNLAIDLGAQINAAEALAGVGVSNAYIDNTTATEVTATVQSAAISAVGGLASAGVAAVGSATSGNPAGAVSAIAGGVIGAATTAAQTMVSTNLLESQAEATKQNNSANVTNTNNYNSVSYDRPAGRAGVARDINTTTNTSNNALVDTVANNNVATAKEIARDTKTDMDTIALDTRDTAIGNADRTWSAATDNADNTQETAKNNNRRTRDTVTSAINNQIAQAALRAPEQFGLAANGEYASQRPQSVFANIVTQPKSAIRRAGDHFLRFGYAYDGAWQLEDFNVMPRFTYWECSDLWMRGLDMPDEHVDQIRFLLMGGVTVWRKPEYIGNTSIYDNR